MTDKKTFTVVVSSTAASIYRVELFNALADRTTQMNTALDAINANFISTNVGSNTLAGVVKLATQGNARGVIGWADLFGQSALQHLNNAGTEQVLITTGTNVFTYRQLIEFLKTNSVYVGNVKIQCEDVSQLKNNWQIIRRMPDGEKQSEEIILSNIIKPGQVRTDVIEFDLNRVIDKYTAIQFDVTPINFKISISFEFKRANNKATDSSVRDFNTPNFM